MTSPRRTSIRIGLYFAFAALLFGATPAFANQSTATSSSNQAVTTQANLDFIVNMGKFVFLRVGTGTYPTASGTIDTVNFSLTPTIPPNAIVPTAGNNRAVAWNGTAPTFGTSASAPLTVEVRSNAGQIKLTAMAATPLTSGANSIPLSQILITSSDNNLPAPLVPNTGTSAAVNVTGSSFGNLVTQRSANWTFSFANTVTPAAGTYTGQITFTASSP